ncbi:MAG: YrhB family protein [Chromatiales bacterium]|nr:YrhB family protein [Chromatiales bacterium]
MNKNDAENIVAHKLELEKVWCAIVPSSTKEYAKCFAVYYQAEKYLETGDFNSMLVGHGAVLVDKVTENIFKTGSAFPTSQYVGGI